MFSFLKSWKKEETPLPVQTEASKYAKVLREVDPEVYNHFTLNHLGHCLKLLPGTVDYDIELYFPDGSMLTLGRFLNDECVPGVPEYEVYADTDDLNRETV